MNPLTPRPILWASALGLFGLSGFRAAAELRDLPAWREGLRGPTRADLTVGPSVELVPRLEVGYGEVVLAFHELDWTGAPPPVPVTTTSSGSAPPPPPAASELLRILMVRLDEADPAGHRVFLEYTSEAGVDLAQGFEDQMLGVGDRLLPPHQGVRLVAIELEAVTFGFEDGRPEERLLLDGGTRVIQDAPGASGASEEDTRPLGPVRRAWPERTVERVSGHFQVGSEDVLVLQRDYATILNGEVRLGRHRDPVTGRYDGIAVHEVAPGSFGARHGLQSGDVLKSLNGHPVTSLAEAKKHIENHKHETSRWEAEIENQGRTRILTFETE